MRAAWNFIALVLSRFICQMLANFFWYWILKDCIKVQEKKRKVVVLCSRPQNKKNVKLGTSIVQRRLRNRDRCAKLLCFKSKPVAFLSFSLPSPSSLLKLLMYTDNLSAGRRKNGFCQERLKLVEARLQIASTHVVGSYANLFEQKKVFIREESLIPTGFLFWYTYMVGVSKFCTPLWPPWRLQKKTWPIPSLLRSHLNSTLGQQRPMINLRPCSRQKLYK